MGRGVKPTAVSYRPVETGKGSSHVTSELKEEGDNSGLERLLCNIVDVYQRVRGWRQTSQVGIEGTLARKVDGTCDGGGASVSQEKVG